MPATHQQLTKWLTIWLSVCIGPYEYIVLWKVKSLQKDRFRATFLASSSRVSKGDRSLVMLLGQMECGHPGVLSRAPVLAQNIWSA